MSLDFFLSPQFVLGLFSGAFITSAAVFLTIHLVSQPIDRIGEDQP